MKSFYWTVLLKYNLSNKITSLHSRPDYIDVNTFPYDEIVCRYGNSYFAQRVQKTTRKEKIKNNLSYI